MSQTGVFGPDDNRDKHKGKSWRDLAYHTNEPKSNQGNWRDSDYRSKYTNVVGITDTFSLLKDNHNATKKEIDNKPLIEFTDITPSEAQKMGYCEESRNRMNQARAQKRQQFYQSRGIQTHE